jgi:hypothetical protein
MDSGQMYGSCAECGQTMSAHINTSRPTECKFVRRPSAEELALQEAAVNAKRNRLSAPTGLKGDGPCYCHQYESHDGRCLGPYCYCH